MRFQIRLAITFFAVAFASVLVTSLLHWTDEGREMERRVDRTLRFIGVRGVTLLESAQSGVSPHEFKAFCLSLKHDYEDIWGPSDKVSLAVFAAGGGGVSAGTLLATTEEEEPLIRSGGHNPNGQEVRDALAQPGRGVYRTGYRGVDASGEPMEMRYYARSFQRPSSSDLAESEHYVLRVGFKVGATNDWAAVPRQNLLVNACL